MSSNAQLKLLNLYKGQPLRKAAHALEVAEKFIQQKKTELRIKLVGYKHD